MEWNGSVVVITGASKGIGKALAGAAAARGARLGLVARSRDTLEQVLVDTGGVGACATADVSDRAQAEAAIASLTEQLGPVDILVNNAGLGAYGYAHETPVEEFERLMQVNYLGAVYATMAVIPSMLERGRGHIVNVASIAGRIGAPLEAAYSASKFAMAGLSEAMSLELANKGVGVTMINPGPVATDFFDTRGVPYQRSRPKPVTAEAVAAALVSAVERGRTEVTIPRWLRFPQAIKVLWPRAFRSGTLRDFRKDLA